MRKPFAKTVLRLSAMLALVAAGAVRAQGVPEPGIVLYGKVWGVDGLVHSGELRWTYSPAGGGSIQVTVPLEEIVTASGDVYCYRAIIPAESAVAGTAVSLNTLPVTDAPVQYARAAAIDGVPVDLAPGRAVDTFSRGLRGKVGRVDLAKSGVVVPTYAMSGTVAYSGRQPGNTLVQAFNNPGFSGTPAGTAVLPDAGKGAFLIADLDSAAYYVRAFRDHDGDGLPGDSEAHGTFAGNPVVLPPDATTIHIALTDIDADDDGLPDWWENLRPGGMTAGFDDDDDDDGAPNGLEYAAGTDPDSEDSAPGPLAWWSLDDGGGNTAADTSGNGHDGALANGPVWTDGIRVGALRFDGVDDRVVVPSAPDLGVTAALTLQAWVRREGTWTEDGRILCKHDSALGTGYSLALNRDDGKLELHLSDGHRFASSGVIPADRWVHAAATFAADVGNVNLYIDGRLDSTHPHAEPCTTNALDLQIGSAASGRLHFVGLIDEPKVFAYARTAGAIAADAFAITAFAINAGAAATSSRTVTLDTACAGYPVDYMASESADFAGATWEPYAVAPPFVLSVGDGVKTVHLRVRTADGDWGPVSAAITLDSTPAAVVDVDATTPDGIYPAGSIIDITVAFTEAVTVTGTPRLRLETGADDSLADYLAGSGTSVLTFRYAVAAGHVSTALDCTGTEALTLSGGTVRDGAGNDADLTLPPPGAAHSLGANRAIAVGNVHTLTYSAGPNGHLGGPSPQRVLRGADGAPVSAIADNGFVFAQWSDDSRENPRTDRNVITDLTVTAEFEVAGPVPPAGIFLAVLDVAAAATGRCWWDLSGIYATTVAGQALTLNLTHDPRGKLSGTATYTVAKDTPVTMPIKGSVKGASGSIAMKGTLRGADPAKTVSVSLALNLTLNTASRQLPGRLTGSVKTDGTTTPVDADLTLAIPGGMDGTWTLQFDLGQAGRSVTGTALLRLSNGVDYTFSAKGRPGANNTAVLSLTGDPRDPASSLKIRTAIAPMAGGGARIESFSGTGYGQALGW